MLFSKIIGQEELKTRLIETVKKQRISHAQLFLGKTGYGTLPIAIAYAQYISCLDKLGNDSCGVCNSCIKFEKLIHPDLHFSFPVNTNDHIKSKPVSDDFIPLWRELFSQNPYFNSDDWSRKIGIEDKKGFIGVQESKNIIKKLSFKPYESEFKLLLIFKPESLNQDASNKLLKLIEEPTDKTIIILIAEDEEQLLKTITSRTQIIRIPPIDQKILNAKLEEKTSKEIANRIAGLSQGDYSFALSKIEKEEEDLFFFEKFKVWMRVCYKADIRGIQKWVEEISAASVGREKRKRFVLYAIELMREGILRNYAGNEFQQFFGAEDKFVNNFAPFVHAKNVLPMSEILNEAHLHINRNAYSKILFMDLSMKFANLLHVKNVHL
jgi:DNA polymerase-3 subunit delta'